PHSKSKPEDDEEDNDGFDHDGIGKVRVLSRRNEPVSKRREPDANFSMPRIQAVDEGELHDHGPTIADEPTPSVSTVDKVWRDVYLVNIMAREGHELDGQDLLRGFKMLGFRFGEMDIFHRHLEPDGQGDVLFSAVNMVKPGTFDPARMVHFSTPGISLFMQLPHAGRAEAHLKLMMQAADKLAGEVDGLLMDMERKPLTEYMLNQYFDELRAYDSQ
ncbi:MAG: cell division protein ZipA, partial [Aeromonadaceae bacterium]